MGSRFEEELNRYLNSPEANLGFETLRGQQLLSKLPLDDDEVYKYFVNFIVPSKAAASSSTDVSTPPLEERAARSYRAMNILKMDLSRANGPPALVPGPTQAGLLMKDLLSGLSEVASDDSQRYVVFHIRELLDALVEAYPEKAMSAAAAGGKQAVDDHLGPLMRSDQTLAVLTHLVCIGATGRKGVASAEKSAQHTAMYHHMNYNMNKISLGQRRKFVKAMSDFAFLDHLADGLASKSAGEELCDAILTILEVIGYPPEASTIPGQAQRDKDKKDEMVGEDILLSPLGNPNWWGKLFLTIQRRDCTFEQREAIARACNHIFALATGNSSRICKSHAPATDATEQTAENIVEEKEEKVVNRLVEWGLTDKIHAALRVQLPLLIQVLNLPTENILTYQATYPSTGGDETDEGALPDLTATSIRHPGRYLTLPLGSWRLQLLCLLKEILTYRGKPKGTDSSKDGPSPCALAMDAVMELPIPPEILKSKTSKRSDENGVQGPAESSTVPFNPWPALCSFVWAYENNDFYHILFFQMLQSVVLEHHEPSLRLILQKSKFLSRAVGSLNEGRSLRGVLINCLNLLHLRSKSLPPSSFLHQYLGSHDGWKANVGHLTKLTLNQQLPIKKQGTDPTDDVVLNLNLGSDFALELGLSEIEEWDNSTATTACESSIDEAADHGMAAALAASPDCDLDDAGENKKKKKNNKKKKKK